MTSGSSSAASVTVVVPTWNGRELLARCLQGLAASSIRPELIVVDNGSTDGTAGWVQSEYPHVRLIQNSRNLGFAAAVNQGIRATTRQWMALLNNDAVPEADWLAQLLAVGESDPRVGSVASRMMFRDAPALVSSAGIRLDRSGAAWDLLLGESRWPAEPLEVFGASAGACLYRLATLQDVGLLDEAFFAYREDVDLAWRARLRGWKALLAPGAVVYHALSATAGEGSTFKRYYLARNKWRVIIRNYPAPALFANLPIILLYDCLSLGASLAQGDLASLRGRLDALRQLPALIRQRSEIHARRTATWAELRAAMSPLESPLTLYRRSKLVSRLASRAAE